MFFSPTLQSLAHPSLGNHVKILCLSTGNESGLGETRRKELEKAALILGVRKREDVFVMDDPRFQDGMQNQWKPEEIARVLGQAFAPQLVAAPEKDKSKEREKERDKDTKTTEKPHGKYKSTSGKRPSNSRTSSSTTTSKSKSPPTATTTSTPPPPPGPRATIDVLLTFDAAGISSHPNHIALYHGARLFLSQIMRGHSGYACPVSLYTLTSTNIARKYSFILDVIPTFLSGIYGTILGIGKKRGGRDGMKGPDRLIFVSDMWKYWKAKEAMVSGHKSQMVWFRWGWIGLGRYMVVNDLKRERVVAT